MRSLICLAVIFPLALPAEAPGPVLRTTATEVLLDFVVRDKKAHPVRDLRLEEVQVFEDGVPQKLRQVRFVESGRTPAAATPTPEPEPAAPAPAAPPPRPTGTPALRSVNELRDITVVSVLVGQMNPQGRPLLLQTMRDFIKRELRPDTYIGVFQMDPYVHAIQPYSNDAEKIIQAITAAVMHVGLRQPGNIDVEDGVFPATGEPLTGLAADIYLVMATHWVSELHDIYQGSVRELTAVQRLVQSQATIPGRKVVLLFTAGLLVHPATVEALQASISAANRSNVTVYAMDTRDYSGSDLAAGKRMLAGASKASMTQMMSATSGGTQEVAADQVMSPEMAQQSIYSSTRGNLRQLAEGTGGAMLPSQGDLHEPLRRAMEDSRLHYEASYSPANTEIDGRFRKIEVKVSRPGVTVFARSGYYALPVVNGRPIYPFEMATMKALTTKPQPRDFDFRAAALQFRPGLDQTQCVLAVEVPTRELRVVQDGKWSAVHVAITALVRGKDGQVVRKINKDLHYEVPAEKAGELQRGAVSFTAPFQVDPGQYILETGLVDRESLKASVRRAVLVVDEGSGLSMSDVTAVRRVDPAVEEGSVGDPFQTRGSKVTPELSESVPPDSSGMLRFYAVAYVPTPVDAPIQMSIEMVRDGQPAMRSPAVEVPPEAGGAVPLLASVPVDKLAAGRYDALVTVHYKGKTVTKGTSVTVGVTE